jgi:hypothetical protein
METRWLSYDEIAAALRITPASARRLVARNKQWPRKSGNDGRARIGIPAERLPPDNPTDAVPDVRHDAVPDDIPGVSGTIAALEAHVETLKAALAKAETEAARERGRADGLNQDLDVAWRELALAKAEAATVPALKTALAASRDQTAEIRAERDRVLTREHLREQRRWYRRLVGR